MSKRTGKYIKCVICKKEIYVSGWQIKKGFGIYCSRKCNNQSKIGNPSWNKGRTKKLFPQLSNSGAKIGNIPWNKNGRMLDIVGEKHYNWKGGKSHHSSGYNLVIKKQRKYSEPSGKYSFEHRIIVEKHIGRPLKTEEVVHHINRIKCDNKIENLMVFKSNSAHHRFHHNPLNVRPEEIIFDGRNHSKTMISKSTPPPV